MLSQSSLPGLRIRDRVLATPGGRAAPRPCRGLALRIGRSAASEFQRALQDAQNERVRSRGNSEAPDVALVAAQVLPHWHPETRQVAVNQLSDAVLDAVGREASQVRLALGLALGQQSRSVNNVALRLCIEGDQVDVLAWAMQPEVEETLLAVRKDLADALSKKGLNLRSLKLGGPELFEDGEDAPLPAEQQLSNGISVAPLRRSFMEVIG